MSDQLKIMAMDALDLAVISAHVQDAVLKGGEIEYSPHNKQLVLPINRFAWEADSGRRGLFKKYERRLSVLHFAQVESVRTKSIDRQDKTQILSLLAITFSPTDHGDDLSGTLEFTFAGNAAMSVQIECIEAQLSDLGARWTARGKPRHIPSSGG